MKFKLLLALVLTSLFLTPNFAQKRTVKALTTPIRDISTNNNAQVLPIKRVILYSNGVAYIERRGIVSGNTEINLSFKQSQVDDVLKSMVVLDLGQGRIGAVSYNSSAPPSAKMAEIPFSVEAQTGQTTGIASVLSQLQGAKVAVNLTKGSVNGSILTVEKRQVTLENKSAVTKTFLVIASETGELSTFDLDEVRSVKLLEEGTRRDVNEFANATASTRRRDAKTISVTSIGANQREMIISYTVAAPIWKTTYRVVLDQEGKPFFQGWAIVDNVSDEDWSNVQLSLVSGSPISFIQPIQQPFYRYRPVVPIPNDLKLNPQVYEEQGINGQTTVNTTNATVGNTINNKDINGLPINGRRGQQLQLQPGVSQNGSVNGNRGFQTNGASGSENNVTVDGQEATNYRTGISNTSVTTALLSGNSGVQTGATGDEIGDLFEYKIDQPVTVNRDRSALIPIVQTKMEGERVSIYNENVRRDRPMGGMKLVNTTALTLEGGSITILDKDAYAGEALMDRLKPKEERFISYALDLGTLVTTKQVFDNSPVKLVKIVNGIFQAHYFREEKKTYTLQNQTDRPRVVYIEYPVRQGWKLSDETLKPTITTANYYRFRVELKALDKQEITVSEQQNLVDSYALTNINQSLIELFLTRKYINDATKQRLEKLIDLRNQINQIQAKLQALTNEESKIAEDQNRLRENIETLSKTPEAKTLITRYVEKVNTQETRLETITKERESLEQQRIKLEQDLSVEIRNFEIK